MTVLSAIREACAVIGVDIPSAVYASTEREHIELATLANEMAVRIAKEHDWNALKSVAALIGDGSTTSFPIPANYDRMVKHGSLWSSARSGVPLTHITDDNIWLADQVTGGTGDNPEWKIIGSEIHARPAIPVGETVSYFYITTVPQFTLDTDVYVLRERLLKLGIIWQWKAQKGLQYAEDYSVYQDAMKMAIDDDMGAGFFEVGSNRISSTEWFVTPAVTLP